MIELIFYFGTEIIMVRINQTQVKFTNSAFGAMETPIEGIKLSHDGVIKEFPDLKDNENWRQEAINRFKAHLSSLDNEEAIANYVAEDLKKFGYQPKWKQKQGFRREKLG